MNSGTHGILDILDDDVAGEIGNALHKFGAQNHLTDLEWLAVLGEEFGEVAMHVTKTSVPPITNPEFTPDMLRAELVQVAAVAVRWVAVLDHRSEAPL